MRFKLKPYSDITQSDWGYSPKIPSHWNTARLKDLAALERFGIVDGPFGTQLSVSEYVDVGIPLIRIKNLSYRGCFRAANLVYITEEKWRSLSRSAVYADDIVVAKTGATIGKSALVPKWIEKGLIASSCIKYTPEHSLVDPRFMIWLISSDGFQKQIVAAAGGSTRSTINVKPFSGLEVAYPPKGEQHSIVRFLNYIDRLIQKYICAKKKLIKLLEEQKQAIINQAVTKGLNPDVKMKPSGIEWLGEIPEHWEAVTLRRVIYSAIDGPHFSPDYIDEGIPFLSARNIKVDRWSLADAKYISQGDYAEFSKRVVPEKGDVLFTKGGTTGIARVVDLDFPFQIWVHVAVLKVKKSIIQPSFLAMALNSSRCYEQSQLLTKGATNQDLGLNRMKGIYLAVPPLDEQQEILDNLNEIIPKSLIAVKRTKDEISLLGEYRTRLISDVVTGKIDVREIAIQLPDEEDDFDVPELDDSLDEAIDDFGNEVEEDE